jgi:hypothetical protein
MSGVFLFHIFTLLNNRLPNIVPAWSQQTKLRLLGAYLLFNIYTGESGKQWWLSTLFQDGQTLACGDNVKKKQPKSYLTEDDEPIM